MRILMDQQLRPQGANPYPHSTMEVALPLLTLLCGALAGFATASLFARSRLHQAAIQTASLESTLQARDEARQRADLSLQELRTAEEAARLDARHLEARLADEQARRETETRIAAERLAELKELKERFEHTFKALSSEALKNNNESFLELARQTFEKLQNTSVSELEKRQQAIQELVSPLRKSLEQVDQQIRSIEKIREGAYQSIREQVRGLLESQSSLQKETANLVQALRTPNVRGRWGEVQLQRTVEFAGMLEHVDFIQQAGTNTEDGALRPDMIIRLPGGRQIIVDAKAPLDAYLRAVDATDSTDKHEVLEHHSRQVRDHIRKLGSKRYWQQFSPTPEVVVLFLPGEAFFSAALEKDPTLIEAGARENVLIATPTTLIALLRAIAFGWRQEQIAEEAQATAQLGRELYDRIATMANHFTTLGNALNRSVTAYNQTMTSLDARVLVTARRFQELGSFETKPLPNLNLITAQPTPPKAKELQEE